MDSISFFGYGANRNHEKIKQIIGRDPGNGLGAIVKGYQLCIQTLSQIPKGPREVLQKSWGNNFKSYTLKKGKGIVGGTVWDLTDKEFHLIKEWEFIGAWRELVTISVQTANENEVTVFSEKAPDILPISQVVDGLLYDEFEFTNLRDTQQKKEFYSKEQLEAIRNELKKATSNRSIA